jgi:hypothetical protein
MCADLLTHDNIHLSRTKTREFSSISEIANDGKTPIEEHVAALVRDSLAENTRRAYLSDLAHFESWGGQVPATAQLIASYLAAHAETSSTASPSWTARSSRSPDPRNPQSEPKVLQSATP